MVPPPTVLFLFVYLHPSPVICHEHIVVILLIWRWTTIKEIALFVLSIKNSSYAWNRHKLALSYCHLYFGNNWMNSIWSKIMQPSQIFATAKISPFKYNVEIDRQWKRLKQNVRIIWYCIRWIVLSFSHSHPVFNSILLYLLICEIILNISPY